MAQLFDYSQTRMLLEIESGNGSTASPFRLVRQHSLPVEILIQASQDLCHGILNFTCPLPFHFVYHNYKTARRSCAYLSYLLSRYTGLTGRKKDSLDADKMAPCLLVTKSSPPSGGAQKMYAMRLILEGNILAF